MKKLKVVSSKSIEDIQKKEVDKQTITSLSTWVKLNEFLESYGKENRIKSGIVIIRTDDGDILSDAINMSGDELIATLEEIKQRYFFNKFFGD